MPTAATAPTPAPPAPSVGERVAARFDLSDRRNLAGLGILCFCLGVMAGARLMRGAVPPLPVGGPTPPAGGGGTVPGPVSTMPPVDVPCAGCRERMIQEGRAAVAAQRAAAAQAAADAGTVDPETDETERGNVAARQQVPPEGARTFSPYAESTLPAEHVEQ